MLNLWFVCVCFWRLDLSGGMLSVYTIYFYLFSILGLYGAVLASISLLKIKKIKRRKRKGLHTGEGKEIKAQ